MTPPPFGSWNVLVRAARVYSIHGDLYYELHVNPDPSPAEIVVLRVPEHVLKPMPQAGQRISVTFLMGQVTGAVLLPETAKKPEN